MESCQICYEAEPKYTVQCGSSVPHTVCYKCETEMRLKSKPTPKGRVLTCPFCRGVEKMPGNRSRTSYEAELALLYKDIHARRTPLHYEFQAQTEMASSIRTSQEWGARSQAVYDLLHPRTDPIQDLMHYIDPAFPAPSPVTAPAPVPPVTAPSPVPPARRSWLVGWCQSGQRERGLCTTRNKTKRNCSYPGGCDQLVCRTCRMCLSHFPSP